MTEHHFLTWDGAKIFYRAWLPAQTPGRADSEGPGSCARAPADRNPTGPTWGEAPARDQSPARAVLLFHRGHEHSGRWENLALSLAADDVAVFAWDQRGHGRSDGDRGCAPNLAAVVRDADRFARHVAAAHGIATADTAVVASSLGAVVATAWVHDYGPPVRGLVLAAAALEVKLYVPAAVALLRAKETLLPGGRVKSFVRSSMLTRDPAGQKAYDADPLIFRQIAVDLLLDLHDAGKRLVADAGAITTPTLLLVAGNDWVVKRKPQFDFLRRLGSPVKQMEFFDGAGHALFHDTVAPAVVESVRGFLKNCFADGATVDRTQADRGSGSRTEYDMLRTPSSLPWRAMRQWVRLGGVFSKGLKLGASTGFDSGQSLDYVYENKPAGLTPVGRWVDRGYLNAIGWRGIRVRRTHLERLLRLAIDRTRAAGKPVHVLDVAAGPGRYVLELMREHPDMTAELRDYRQANLDAGAALAKSLGIDRAVFKSADAFDRDSLAAAAPKPTIAIVSGLYELFPENDPVRRSLAGIGDAVADEGFLIYTCQPWHPQVEFIARTLVNREGRPWVMRRRSQAEMDALVGAAGFEKIDQMIDRWGIFTVSLARKKR